jgi:hypothetical protein
MMETGVPELTVIIKVMRYYCLSNNKRHETKFELPLTTFSVHHITKAKTSKRHTTVGMEFASNHPPNYSYTDFVA